jgi:choline dehydrogenase
VIVCAGTVNAPQLLMLSGIGAAAGLQRHGVSRGARPARRRAEPAGPPDGVDRDGEPQRRVLRLSWRSAGRVALAPLRYAFGQTGMLASNAAEAGGFIRTSPTLDRPDVQYTFMVGLKDNPRTLPRKHGYFLHMAVLRPRTRGTVELASADPAAKPVLRPQFLEDRRDVLTLMAALREARRIIAMPALQRLVGGRTLARPGAGRRRRAGAFIRDKVATTYHPAGTCKMGPDSDPQAVVDAQLRVHGVEGLRVADASIMPNLIGGNTSAPSMMIGERAAHFILHGVPA